MTGRDEIMELSKNHALYQLAPDVNAICSPLFNFSGVTSFRYGRIYNDNAVALLSTMPELEEKAIQENTVISYQRLKDIIHISSPIDENANSFVYFLRYANPFANNLLKNYGEDNGFIMGYRKEHYIECFGFSSKANADMAGFYFNNIDKLIKFKHLFLDKSCRLIDRIENQKIKRENNNDRENTIIMPFDEKKFDEAVTPSHYTLYHKKRDIKITAQEFECLRCLAQGRTDKETARLLNISDSTVRTYQDRLKQKLRVDTRKELINIFLASELTLL